MSFNIMNLFGPTCEECGSIIGLEDQLQDSIRRHSRCVDAMRKAQYFLAENNIEEALEVLNKSIGPLKEDHYK